MSSWQARKKKIIEKNNTPTTTRDDKIKDKNKKKMVEVGIPKECSDRQAWLSRLFSTLEWPGRPTKRWRSFIAQVPWHTSASCCSQVRCVTRGDQCQLFTHHRAPGVSSAYRSLRAAGHSVCHVSHVSWPWHATVARSAVLCLGLEWLQTY